MLMKKTVYMYFNVYLPIYHTLRTSRRVSPWSDSHAVGGKGQLAQLDSETERLLTYSLKINVALYLAKHHQNKMYKEIKKLKIKVNLPHSCELSSSQ